MDMKNCRPQLNGTFSSTDCLDSVRNWFVTKNDNSIASSRPNAKNISLVDFDNFCIDVADTVQPLVWNGTPLQGFSESPATTQISLFESYFNEGDHTTLLGLREIDNIVKPNCGNTSPPPSPPLSGGCGGPMVTTWDFPNHPDAQPTLTLPLIEQSLPDDLGIVTNYNFNFTVDWGDGTTSEVTSFSDPDKTHTYPSKGTYTITISGTLQGWGTKTSPEPFWDGSGLDGGSVLFDWDGPSYWNGVKYLKR